MQAASTTKMLRPRNSPSPSKSLSELFTPPPDPSSTQPPQQPTSPQCRQRSPQPNRIPLPASPGFRGRAYSPSPLSRGIGSAGAGRGGGRSASPLVRGVSRSVIVALEDEEDEEDDDDDDDDWAPNGKALNALMAGGNGDDKTKSEDANTERGKAKKQTHRDESTPRKAMPSPKTPPSTQDTFATNGSGSIKKTRINAEGGRDLQRSISARSAQDPKSKSSRPLASPPLPPAAASASTPTTPTRTSMTSLLDRPNSPTLSPTLQHHRIGSISPTPSRRSGGKHSHRSVASVASTVISENGSTISPTSSIEGSPIREGPKLSMKNKRRLRERKTQTDANPGLYSMNPTMTPTSSLHISASTNDLPDLHRPKSIGGASTKTNKSVSSVFSSVTKNSITLPTMPWLRKEKGENMEQLEDSGFFERTTLPPKKVTRLPVLTIASGDMEKIQNGSNANRESVLLTPTAFYDNKRQSVRFSWNMEAYDEEGDAEKRNMWIPANRFSWAIREKDGIPDPVKDKRISRLARLSALPPVHEVEAAVEPARDEEAAEDHDDNRRSTTNQMRWSLYAAEAPSPSPEEGTKKLAEGSLDDIRHTEVDAEAIVSRITNRRSWMLSTGSPSHSPKEVRVLAAVPDEEHSTTDKDDDLPSSSASWPLKILSPYDVPDGAEILAVIAEEDEGDENIGQDQDTVKGDNTTAGSWPMMVMSPGLPPLKMVGMASIDENDADERDEPDNADRPNVASDIESPQTTPSPELSEIAPLRSLSNPTRRSGGSERERVVGLAPYQHGPIELQRPEDVLRKGSITGMGIWGGDDSSIAAFEKTEAVLVEGILDYFSCMIGTSEAACGVTETNDERELADQHYLSAPLLDDALIQEHAHGLQTEKKEKKNAKRPPPPPLPPLPPPPPSMPDFSPVPPLPPTPPTPLPSKRPDSITVQRPTSLARTKSTKGAKGVHSPSFGSLLLKRNIF